MYVSSHHITLVPVSLFAQVRSEAEQETAKLTPGFRQIASKLETFIEENAGEQKVCCRDVYTDRLSRTCPAICIRSGMRVDFVVGI